MKLHLFEIGDGDWYLAEDEGDAISLYQEDSGLQEFTESVEQLEDDAIWPMLWDLSDLPQEVFLNPEAVIEPLEGSPVGMGWTHRVYAPIRVWSAAFGRGLLASVHY